MSRSNNSPIDLHSYNLSNFDIGDLTTTFIFRHSSDMSAAVRMAELLPEDVTIGRVTFREATHSQATNCVEVRYEGNTLALHCTCAKPKRKLCDHQRQALTLIMNREELRIFFDPAMRQAKLAAAAKQYGMEQEKDLEQFFTLEYEPKSVHIKPKIKGLVSFTTPPSVRPVAHKTPPQPGEAIRMRTIVVLSQHKYYGHFFTELFIAPLSEKGKIKAPLTPLDPMDLIWKAEKPEETKFFAAVSKFHSNVRTARSETDVAGLQALVRNPLEYDFYVHNAVASANITVGSIVPVQLRAEQVELDLMVRIRDIFYEAFLQIRIGAKHLDVTQVDIRFDHFMMVDNQAYLIGDADVLVVLKRFKESDGVLLVHRSKLAEFHHDFLARYEGKVNLSYADLAAATALQLKQQGFDEPRKRIIYLSDSGDFIEITPVLTYGPLEVPVLSRKEILSIDATGKPFSVSRDEETELQFAGVLIRQHPDFEEQLEDGLSRDFLYIHKKRFLENDWFLDAFEKWRELGISILGFNKLTHNNNLNSFKAKITVRVTSGVDWFNTNISVKFDKQQVSLKHLQKSIRNKNRFVQLDDGTLGILPEEWMTKFEQYFEAGELAPGDLLRTPVSRFNDIASLYDQEVFTPDASTLLARLQEKAGNFEAIDPVPLPEGLMATLRPYQRQGLNWLGFLDDFNFGGCLADDMGLGKTLQIIAFILSQRYKRKHNTNLVVVPASLIYNWQEEVQKFAPSLRVLTLYGTGRVRHVQSFDGYEIVLTSYTTLLADVAHLKAYEFNYIFLDESQAIKNPDSQRYKAARLLRARNRIVLSGTPVENNTFDLYGQLSFACPGLLGNLRHFRDHYAVPIDKFKSLKHTRALQQRISPFILRRTKEQVARELPEKTEMILHCEMGPEQRKVYDACEREFRDFLEAVPDDKVAAQSMHILQGLTKLRQLCDSPAIVKDDEYFGNESAKIDTLLEHIENKHVHHKILVFSQFVTMLDLIRIQLETRGIPFQYLTGQTLNRAEKIKDFQNNPDVRVFLISLKAGGTGLNLTEADYVYLVDPWWNPAVENQAIDRAHRIGQHKHVVAVRLICPNTIEEKILLLQQTKKDLVGKLVHSDAGILQSLSPRDLLALLQ